MNELEWCFRPTFRRHRAQDSRSPTRFGILDPTVHQCRQIMLILLIMTVFWWCRRHSGRGHSREGWAWWATHTTVSTADELAGSGWKWTLKVDGMCFLLQRGLERWSHSRGAFHDLCKHVFLDALTACVLFQYVGLKMRSDIDRMYIQINLTCLWILLDGF